MPVSRLKRVPIREVWRNEEKGFTKWLEENIDALEEALGTTLTVIEREARVGEYFEADMLAENSNGNYVVIENQFGKSDHDHLGKLLTYLTNLDAKIAIWICENPKPEHINTIRWLNEITPSDVAFYLIKLETFQIENSPPAPHFSIIASPSKESKEVGEKKKELAERHKNRLEFWQQLLERSKNRTKLFANVSPSKENWINTGAGKTGLAYTYVILMSAARIEFYIDTGNKDENKRIFDKLHNRREQIEMNFGDKLEWQRLDDRRASRIAKIVEEKGLKEKDAWSTIQDKMIDAMTKFEKALSKHIKQLT